MKKTILTLIASIIAIHSFAQLGADGYYRIQNAGTGRYLSIVNNRVDDTNKNALMSGNMGNIYSLATFSDATSDPGSIIYIKKNGTSYDLITQGMSTAKLLPAGASLALVNGNIDGAYNLAGKYSGFTLYLVDVGSGDEGNCKTGKKNDAVGNWYIKPIDQTNEYFCIKPDLAVGDKYYTTIYTAFPFQLAEGMKAYYVSDYFEKAAQMDEIESGIVPAGTPAIIECSSNNPSDNIVTPLTSANSNVIGNKLIGLYFNYVRKSSKGGVATTDLAKYLMLFTVEYNASTMKVLGEVDGKLAMVDAPEDYLQFGKYLPANKAYLPIDIATKDYLPLLDKEGYEEAKTKPDDDPDPKEQIITDEQATYKVDEESQCVSLISDDNVSGDYEIPETVSEEDGTEYIVNAIGEEAFKDNKELTKITIPSTITQIGERAFAGCENLMAIIINAEEPIDLNKARTRADGSSVFEGVDYETCILYVPEGSVEKYKAAPVWSNFKTITTLNAENGIHDIRLDEKMSDIYNLQGQKVRPTDQLPRGVYIINGKKMIKK